MAAVARCRAGEAVHWEKCRVTGNLATRKCLPSRVLRVSNAARSPGMFRTMTARFRRKVTFTRLLAPFIVTKAERPSRK
jgi:hypothetical protein